MNLEFDVRAVVKATVEADSTYVSLLQLEGGTAGQTKTFGKYVDPSVKLPYVLITRYAGGMDNDAIGSNASTSMWVVSVVTEQDEALAMQIAGIINTLLEDKVPVVPVEVTDALPFGPISLIYPYFETMDKLNFTYIRAGGIYTIRLATKG